MTVNNQLPHRIDWKILLTILLRLCVGVLFVYSGFVKGVDPWGTVYKIQYYLQALGLQFPQNIVVAASFTLISIEFITGIFLVFGCYRRISTWMATIIMSLMLPLSVWIVIANPVQDCGCFGDAWIISNTSTLYKNIILFIAVVWLLKYNRHIRTYITPSLQWIGFLSSGMYILIVIQYGYTVQPAIDFRPYKVGSQIIQFVGNNSEDTEYTFIYEKNGKQQEFNIDNIPSTKDGWSFVDRKRIKPSKVNIDDEKKLLRIYDLSGTDVTEDILLSEGKTILLLFPELDNFNIASAYQINTLYDYCQRNNATMNALVAATNEEISHFVDVAMPEYPIYVAEDTNIKELARGCPAVVLLQNGVIKWKTQLQAIDTSSLDKKTDILSLHFDYSVILPWMTSAFLLFEMLLVVLSLLPRNWKICRNYKSK